MRWQTREINHEEEIKHGLPKTYPRNVPVLFLPATSDGALPLSLTNEGRLARLFPGGNLEVRVVDGDHWFLQARVPDASPSTTWTADERIGRAGPDDPGRRQPHGRRLDRGEGRESEDVAKKAVLKFGPRREGERPTAKLFLLTERATACDGKSDPTPTKRRPTRPLPR